MRLRPVGAAEYSQVSTLNDYGANSSTFPAFPTFPAEDRIMIWKAHMQQPRIVSIELVDQDNDRIQPVPRLPAYRPRRRGDKNSMGRTVSGRHNRIAVARRFATGLLADAQYYYPPNPLFYVNWESPVAALEFYRVHLPYNYDTYGEMRCFYFNPELDYLELDVCVSQTFYTTSKHTIH